MKAIEQINHYRRVKDKFWKRPPAKQSEPEKVKQFIQPVPKHDIIRISKVKIAITDSKKILLAISNASGFSIDEICGIGRSNKLVIWRHVAMYMMREYAEYSFPKIGRILNRDHGTVQHGCNRVVDQRDKFIHIINKLKTDLDLW